MTSPFLVYVTNLSYKDDESTVQALFQQYGPIAKIDYSTNTCTVHYKQKPDARLFDSEIIHNEKILKIVKSKKNGDPAAKQVKSSCRLFISNINKNLKIVDVRRIARKVGKVVDVKVHNTGPRLRNKGYCFVEFKSDADARRLKEEFKTWRNEFGESPKVEYAETDRRKYIKNR